MRKSINYFFSVVLFFLATMCFNVVEGWDIEIEGDSSVGTFESCGKWNGCSRQIGYKYTLISKYEKKNNKIKYTNENKSTTQKTSKTWSEQEEKIINNEDGVLDTILSKFGIEQNQFVDKNKDYAIMVEPIFENFYVNLSKSCEGESTCYNYKEMSSNQKTAKESALWLSQNDYKFYNKYGGFRNINRSFMCNVYISGVGQNDSLCKSSAQTKYRKDYLKYTAEANSPYGVAIVKASSIKIKDNYYIKIKKIDETTKKLIQVPAEFTLYEGFGCDVTTKKETKETRGGVLKFENLTKNGEYSIKETKLPVGYDYSYGENYCYNIKIEGKNKEITWSNNSSCTTRLSTIEKTPQELIKLYKEYLSEGYDYNMLLNFNNPSCKNKPCNGENNENSALCLVANLNLNEFSKDDLSCYTSKLDDNGKTAFCQESFLFNNNLGITSHLGFVYAGQMILKYEQGKIAGTGTLTRECYSYDGNIKPNETLEIETYEKYISDVKLKGQSLEYEIDVNKTYLTQLSNGFIMNIVTNYKFNDIKAELGTGAIITNETKTQTRTLGSGVVTDLIYTKTEIEEGLDLDFEIIFGEKFLSNDKVENLKGTCEYNVKEEIITKQEKGNPNPKLNLEFRIIDTKNPFPGKNGNSRLVGDNWCYSNEKMKAARLSMLCPVGKEGISTCANVDKKYDVNKDGKLNVVDFLSLFKEIKNEEKISMSAEDFEKQNYKICYNNNKLIEEKILTANNSYNSTGEGAKYTITLDSKTMKKIRSYNSVQAYDDYTLDWSNQLNKYISDDFLRNTSIISSNNIIIKE